ncbi:Uncharacterized protein FWK35_00030570, partial [Aphis craccivora]
MIKKSPCIGMCVLDLSKMMISIIIYLLIHSLILEIKPDDFYQDIKINLDNFDTSDYPKDNIYGLPLVLKKVLGKFKDELNGKTMTEFIGLRSKLYSHRIFLMINNKAKMINIMYMAHS